MNRPHRFWHQSVSDLWRRHFSAPWSDQVRLVDLLHSQNPACSRPRQQAATHWAGSSRGRQSVRRRTHRNPTSTDRRQRLRWTSKDRPTHRGAHPVSQNQPYGREVPILKQFNKASSLLPWAHWRPNRAVFNRNRSTDLGRHMSPLSGLCRLFRPTYRKSQTEAPCGIAKISCIKCSGTLSPSAAAFCSSYLSMLVYVRT